jgi:maltooligosyltrehalose trehalohydrolase
VKTIFPSIESQRQGSWVGTFGPLLEEEGCVFRLWARAGAKIELVLENGASPRVIPMSYQPNGMYETHVKDADPGARYWFKIDGTGPYPDPASRYQPLGVHGPSEVVGPSDFSWATDNFKAPALRNLVIYELHVGAFTPAGNFLGIIDKLDGLQQLGINVIELMPIADFAGEHNWGYDGVSLYAPAHSYGTPDDLRHLVLAAHRREIAVCLDVVYNHLGPDGAYHSTFAPQFYSGKHKTPWGDGLNFDGEGRDKVRAYFIESALSWIYDYHIDGLRADATHAILDDSNPPFLTELTERVHAAGRDLGREVFIIAEDERNERKLVLPPEKGGHGFDAVWSDDFHHHMRHRLAGDSDGYFRDFDGSTASIAKTIEDGWFFDGQFASHAGHGRGTSPEGLSRDSRVFCIQNHDQIGNRAFGERLSTQIYRASWLAASALLLLSPEVPLLFMGQEWAAPEPFLYFTDHNKELGRLVTEGRRKEFEHFSAFADEARRESIPDPQAKETFLQSKLDWNLRRTPEHAACLRWYQQLLHIRKNLLEKAQFHSSHALNDKIVLLRWESSHGRLFAAVALEGPASGHDPAWKEMEVILSSDGQPYTGNPQPVLWDSHLGKLSFIQAGVVLLASGDLVPGTEMERNGR